MASCAKLDRSQHPSNEGSSPGARSLEKLTIRHPIRQLAKLFPRNLISKSRVTVMTTRSAYTLRVSLWILLLVSLALFIISQFATTNLQLYYFNISLCETNLLIDCAASHRLSIGLEKSHFPFGTIHPLGYFRPLTGKVSFHGYTTYVVSWFVFFIPWVVLLCFCLILRRRTTKNVSFEVCQ